MMKLVLAATFALVAMTGSAEAALSGYWDSALKVETALASPDLADVMKQAPIEALSVKDNSVVIQSGQCSFVVDLEAKTPSGPGRTDYDVKSVRGPYCMGMKQ